MDKVIDKFVEWAISEHRWPLLLPLVIPALLKFLQKYLHISFKETVWHWSFLSACGVVFLASGILYFALVAQRWGGRILAATLCLIAAALLLKAYQQYNPSLPGGRLVVAVAQFNPISKAAENEAKNIPHRIEQRLNELRDSGAPLEIKRLKTKVEDTDEAISLATAGSSSAHIVLWGDVRKDDGELLVTPRLTRGRRFRDIQIEERKLESVKSDAPKHMDFKERLSKEIADVIVLVYGIAYYKAEQWGKAIEILNQLSTNEAYLYKALSLSERADGTGTPQQDLRSAIENYEKILGTPPLRLTSEVVWRAYVYRADALATLGVFSPPEEAPAFLREAAGAYERALGDHPGGAPSRADCARIQNNLGVALRQLGNSTEGEEGVQLLRKAVSAFRAVPGDFWKTPFMALVRSQNSLGNTLCDLSTRVENDESVVLLRQAAEAYRAMLPVVSNYKLLPQLGVTEVTAEFLGSIRNNFGAVLLHLGLRVEGDESVRALREAVTAHKAALTLQTKEASRERWAMTVYYLGKAQFALSSRVKGQEEKGCLGEAIHCFDDALSIFDSTNYPALHSDIAAYKSSAAQLHAQP